MGVKKYIQHRSKNEGKTKKKAMARTKKTKFQKYVLTPIYGVIALVLLLMLCLQVFSPDRSVKVFGFQTYLISYTKSMEPMLNYNDLIVVTKYDFKKLEIGDVITFLGQTESGERILITHQVNNIRDYADGRREVQTKGINLSKPDLISVTEDGADGTNKYIGKYAFKSEFLGNLIAYLKSAHGVVALIINGACITGIYILLLKLQKGLNESEDENAKELQDQKLRQEFKDIEREIRVLEEEIRILEESEGVPKAARFKEGAKALIHEIGQAREHMLMPHSYEDIHSELAHIQKEAISYENEIARELFKKEIAEVNSEAARLGVERGDIKLIREILKVQREIMQLEDEIEELENADQSKKEKAQIYHQNAQKFHSEMDEIHQSMRKPHDYRKVHQELVKIEREIFAIEREIKQALFEKIVDERVKTIKK